MNEKRKYKIQVPMIPPFNQKSLFFFTFAENENTGFCTFA